MLSSVLGTTPVATRKKKLLKLETVANDYDDDDVDDDDDDDDGCQHSIVNRSQIVDQQNSSAMSNKNSLQGLK